MSEVPVYVCERDKERDESERGRDEKERGGDGRERGRDERQRERERRERQRETERERVEVVFGTSRAAKTYELRTYRGTSLIRKRTTLGPYRRPMPRVLGGS